MNKICHLSHLYYKRNQQHKLLIVNQKLVAAAQIKPTSIKKHNIIYPGCLHIHITVEIEYNIVYTIIIFSIIFKYCNLLKYNV